MEKSEALEHLVLRLSRLADGADEELDGILADIRRELKSGGDADRLEDLSGRLARSLMLISGVDVDKPPSGDEDYDLSGLRKLIKSMPVRGNEQERMNALVQEVASGQSTLARQKALVELLGAAAKALKELASRDRAEAGVLGWLGKKSGGESGEERYVALFSQLLTRLVEHIDVLNGNALRSHAIKEALDQVMLPEQARNLLDEVIQEIEIIDVRIRAERNQTSDFLGDLRQRLDGFEEVLSHLAEDGGNSLKRSEALKSSVEEDTASLGEAVKSDDPEEVRSRIEDGLSRITRRLAEHVLAERAQHEASAVRTQKLTERLARLEDEADSLRSEIRNKNDLALKDSLTGVYNRAGYEDRGAELFARWERSGSPLSLVFVDCNKFKEINDTYGHASGDVVLEKVADVLQNRARASDVVCRFGGDEFVVLLPDTKVNGAEIFARSASQLVLDAGFNDNGKPLDVSISCGVTELVAGDTLESAIGRADEAMYQAKRLEDSIKVWVVV